MNNNLILRKAIYLFLSVALITTFVSCDDDDLTPEPSGILTDDARGTWVVDMYWDGDYQGQTTINIYNTGGNEPDQVWIDDLGHGWGLLAKVNYDPNTGALSATDADELYYGVTVTINGSITKNDAVTPSGDTVSSITFDADFSDIPGETWTYTGYKSTQKVKDQPE